MTEPNFDTAREVFPVRFDGIKSARVTKDFSPRPVRSEDIHITEVEPPKAPPVQEPATDLTDLIPDESATQTSATAELESSTQTDSDGTDLLDQQLPFSPTESTSPGSETPPVAPIDSLPTAITPTSSSPKAKTTPSATVPSPSTASAAKSAPSAASSAS